MTAMYDYIDTDEALSKACSEFRSEAWLAVDTEFERESTYYPELCLVQLASARRVLIIDPLAIKKIRPLYELLYDRSLTKVFHAARQDLEIFYHLKEAIPLPLFDTQIAAPLLGYDEQMGYARLVEHLLGINLAKTQTRTNWKRRPLSDKQLEYAAEDVLYLAQIYPEMKSELEKSLRIEWMNDDFTALEDRNLYMPEPDSVWKRVKGQGKLSRESLAALKPLASWRETLAREKNKPRNWIMRDEAMIEIVRQLPKTKDDLLGIPQAEGKFYQRRAEKIIALIQGAKALDASEIPHVSKRKSLNSKEESLVQGLQSIVEEIAESESINTRVLASRKQLQQFVQYPQESELLTGWRAKIMGAAFQTYMKANC